MTPAELQQDPVLLEVFLALYQDVNGMEVSVAERERLKTEDSSYTYGEIQPLPFMEVLGIAYRPTDKVFYDLGAGAGKAVIAAALFFDWQKCYGIEFLPGLSACSQQVKNKLLTQSAVSAAKKASVEFVQGDFLQIDFSDADVIYLHATTFSADLWQQLIVKLTTLKPGTRFITITKRLPETHFQLLHEQPLQMTWGEASAFIYNLHK
ncbi:hypothetical protein AYO45_04955 [Gammaproteobacteria bacterium SCGC AG-212-F23]|nr:hypothetical protein AYO45_04955 [Gammaproteobacteria bacterium SCGC AG-212-F23]